MSISTKDLYQLSALNGNETMTQEEEDKVARIKKRLEDMDKVRQRKAKKWDIDELQVDSDLVDSIDGKASINMAIEQNTLEMKLGLRPGVLQYKLATNGEVSNEILQVASSILDYFIYEKEPMTLKQITKADAQADIYGSGFLYIGPRFEAKKKSEPIGEGNKFFNKKFKDKNEIIRHFGIRNIKIRQFRLDDNATCIEDAMDCIYREFSTIEEVRMMYLDENGESRAPFKYIRSIGTSKEEAKDINTKDPIIDRRVIKDHYYNKITGEYCIVINNKWLIYDGRITNWHGELPFVSYQSYIDPFSLYGKGIPKKLENIKGLLNNFIKSSLDSSWLNSSQAIIMAGGAEVDGGLSLESGTITEWNFTGDMSNIQPYNPNINISSNIAMIELLERWILKNTGISIDPTLVLQANTAFQTGVFKEEQNSRLRPGFDDRNYALDRALTLLLSDILQYAPYIYADFVTGPDGKESKVDWYKIRINDKEIITGEEGEIKEVKEKPGSYSIFELHNKILKDGQVLKVRVETPSTMSSSKTLEKAEFNELLITIGNIARLYPQVLELLDPKELKAWLQSIYGRNLNKFDIVTTEKATKEYISKLEEGVNMILSESPELEGALQNNIPTNENQTMMNGTTGFENLGTNEGTPGGAQPNTIG